MAFQGSSCNKRNQVHCRVSQPQTDVDHYIETIDMHTNLRLYTEQLMTKQWEQKEPIRYSLRIKESLGVHMQQIKPAL